MSMTAQYAPHPLARRIPTRTKTAKHPVNLVGEKFDPTRVSTFLSPTATR